MKPWVPGQKSSRIQLIDAPRTPDCLAAWMLRHLDALAVRQVSKASLNTRKSHLAHLNAWCVEHGIENPGDITHAHVEAFQGYLFRYRRRDGKPMAANGQVQVLGSVGAFFTWMVKHRHLPSNPAADVDLPRVPKGLRDPMTQSEVEAVLAQPDVSYAQGLRDRAMLEMFYATGVRRSELAALDENDIERERGTLHVRRGKGGKGRFVPIGERALAWVDKYLLEARPLLQVDPHEAAIFINVEGKRLSVGSLSWRTKRYIEGLGSDLVLQHLTGALGVRSCIATLCSCVRLRTGVMRTGTRSCAGAMYRCQVLYRCTGVRSCIATLEHSHGQ